MAGKQETVGRYLKRTLLEGLVVVVFLVIMLAVVLPLAAHAITTQVLQSIPTPQPTR